jgi:phage terminase large subunit GpA-like protein
MNGAALKALVREAIATFRPPPKLTLSQWAEEFAYLSAESAAEPGKWRNLPYQVGIMDAITDPLVERVTVIKSARVGYTKIVGHALGFFMHYDPCPIMVVQPTEADAEGYSKEEIAPMIRDTPVLRGLVSDAKTRDSGNTILQKQFPGGTLSLVGANSPRGFRRVSRRVVVFDEVDGYPPSAGAEGDQIKLGIRRTEYYWNRKIIAGSTPTTESESRISPMFEESDRRYFHVPCPHCGEFQVLKFPNMKWPENEPEKAYFSCVHCEKAIEHRDKKAMIEAGRWIPEREFNGHAGFHIWAAYSYSPNATWGHIAREFIEAKKQGTESLKTFINTVLGETWKEKGDAPEWERLYDRREAYPIGMVPPGGVFLTAGADVQKDRIEVEIVAWGRGKESWSVDYRVLPGDTATEAPWAQLDALLNHHFETAWGAELPILALAIDTGFQTQQVYNWARRHPLSRVFPIKGRDDLPTIVGQPSAVDVEIRGRKIRRGLKVWPVGSSVIKSELYSWLGLRKPTDPLEAYPPGFMHFPQYGEEFFLMLTAEQLVAKLVKGFKRYQWVKTRDRNEALDCRVYARAAASVVGLDRYSEKSWDRLDPGGAGRAARPSPPVPESVSPAPVAPAPAAAAPARPASRPRPQRPRSSFWNRD